MAQQNFQQQNSSSQSLERQSSPCPNCGSEQTAIKSGTAPHWRRLECLDCGRFLRWLPKPKTEQQAIGEAV